MHITSEHRLDDGVIHREFTFADIPGSLWMPPDTVKPVPLVLLGHPGDLNRMLPRLAGRARRAAHAGLACVTLELPGSGTRPHLPEVDRARVDLQHAIRRGEPVPAQVIDDLVLPLVEHAVPEWQGLLDNLLALPEFAGPVGFSGGVTAIGIRIAAVEPRVGAVTLFAGSFVPQTIMEEARAVTIPAMMLLRVIGTNVLVVFGVWLCVCRRVGVLFFRGENRGPAGYC
ncbi:alpha/beta hydrolase [Bifidobacterium tibiigranuli]|uniref:alpha/beta hydrolase n=2 Tax=Bifidobacterium TaxID=1678 RepID=UPI001269B650|nr:alpha/beta hydrolase [Bifidobacterium tibiigranuli]MCH3974374.1 hypothetical protein [Bifidobacterium tibiigranuli]MCH4190035.1 hypothetical protein [Bifidobacterium tibiigranuli]MCH4204690.1 hypothetical protein [Bifidobacterium tibiigranuli]MCH4275458.1 hypothetical protein [Bifidobacterium tibiigranuli]MCI1212332.1 hypothetical protein [Bifidobacterium tibiigranuli]